MPGPHSYHRLERLGSAFRRTAKQRPLPRNIAAWLGATFLVLGPAAPAAEPLGRLFFTPEQRATLESLRLAPAAATTTATDRVSVDGIVQRSGGPATVWINRVPQTVSPRSLVPSAKGGAPAVEVAVPAQDERVRLRVGESLSITPPPEESPPEAAGEPAPAGSSGGS
jgi:hypothetical protein